MQAGLNTVIGRFQRHRDGATAIEYALITGGIAMAIAGIVFVLGDQIFDFFDAIREVQSG